MKCAGICWFCETPSGGGGAVVLLHFEPDHGAMVILLATVFCLIFLAGAKISRFFPLLLLCVWWCDLHRSNETLCARKIYFLLEPMGSGKCVQRRLSADSGADCIWERRVVWRRAR